MVVSAYAKINLGLRILGKRADGYHALETIFHRVDIHDTLSFEPAAHFSLSCDDPSMPTDETNLCMRAANLLAERYAMRDAVKIDLHKETPVGAGLGGGSA